MAQHFDIIIVGAGAAGCVLASRLSEQSTRNVLLLEAGPDAQPGMEPDDIADLYPTSYFNRDYFWPGLRAHWREPNSAPDTLFPQARVMGGGGSVMGMVALRGVADDYERWQAAGAQGWGWQNVLPYFNRLERDHDFINDGHGKLGPTPVRRLKREAWPPLAHAVEQFGRQQGWPFIEDMNLDFRDGYGVVPMSNSEMRRASSAACYLTADVRRRPNLTIVTAATATRILFNGTRATRVRAAIRKQPVEFHTNDIILAAGAIFSPALLMRSGVGPAAQLQAHNITLVAERRGVGANLQNHAVLFIGMHLRKRARQSAALRTTPALSARFSSGAAGCHAGDLYLNVQSKTSWHALGTHIANISPVLLQPLSRGEVTLSAARGQEYPRIAFHFLQHELDLARLEQAFLKGAELALACSHTLAGGPPFPVPFGNRIRKLNELTRANAIKARLLAAAFDVLPGGVTDGLLARAAGGNIALRQLLADRERLRAHVLQHVAGVFHPVGTCKMGAPGDADAVVDAEGRVYGVQGLRVADASVMPTIVSGNTNIPTLMIAEKIAASFAPTD